MLKIIYTSIQISPIYLNELAFYLVSRPIVFSHPRQISNSTILKKMNYLARMLKFILLAAIFLLLLDAYAFKGVSLLTNGLSGTIPTFIKVVYWTISVLVVVQFINLFTHWHEYRVNRPEFVRFWSSVFFVILFAKMSIIFNHLFEDIIWGMKWLYAKISLTKEEFSGTTITRSNFLTKLGAGMAIISLGAYTYGVVKGRYAFRVIRDKIKFSNLPKAFTGLKIVQISDLHLGSFINDFEEVGKAITMINSLKPDLIFFTGDMVNVHSDEAEPWIDIFGKLEAKLGKYSVFGNHDYCDYGDYTEEEKQQSIDRLKAIHGEMGFRLLEDEHLFIEKDQEKIALIGIHNWGKGFHQEGDLDKAIEGLDESYFQILLSHDPTLWEEKVNAKLPIDLTFSGHTHGMQMGVEIPSLGIKISPIRFRYKRWAGLYSENKNHLYINRGFGFLGFPGRVGMWPEITLLELE